MRNTWLARSTALTSSVVLELDSSFTFQDFNTSNSNHLPAGCRVYFLQCGATSWPIICRHLSESAIQGLLILCWSWHQCGFTVGRRMFFRIKPSGERRYLQIVENTRDHALNAKGGFCLRARRIEKLVIAGHRRSMVWRWGWSAE